MIRDVRVLEADLAEHFAAADEVADATHRRIGEAFREERVASTDFAATNGYGHDDVGRDKFDRVMARSLGCEAAIARINLVSGTHAIGCAVLGNIRPGGKLICGLGEPYDTLSPLLEHLRQWLSVQVETVEPQSWHDPDALAGKLSQCVDQDTSMVFLQRSRGYSPTRPSVSVETLNRLMAAVRHRNPAAICLVDNCYGEFVEALEPKADLLAGSLIKNPGGGIAPAGGYVAGRAELVERAAQRLTGPGIGSECGPNFGVGRLLYQGLYVAPLTVSQAVKGMALAARTMAELGLATDPPWQQVHSSDTILRVDCGSRDKLIEFCKALQSFGPVDAHLTPWPCPSPGYSDELVMAAGTFVEGSTSELSADGPLRPPYAAFLQGGLSYHCTRQFLERLLDAKSYEI